MDMQVPRGSQLDFFGGNDTYPDMKHDEEVALQHPYKRSEKLGAVVS